jgi:uncharacterized protein YkwD
MKKLLKSSVIPMAFLFLNVSCSEDSLQFSEVEANHNQIDLTLSQQTDWQMANQVLTLMNQHRTSIGLTQILSDTQYASAYAVEHTKYMIGLNAINHDNFSVRSAALVSEGATFVGENVAQGYDSAQEVLAAWINSPGHKLIIEGNYTHCGFGILKNETDTYFFTVLFYRE